MLKLSSGLVLAAVAASVSARSLTVTNKCSYTVWPGLFTAGSDKPSQAGGWEAASGNTITFDVPETWSAGRIWGRTECDSSGANCATGDCGGLVCSGTGAAPTSLAEWTLGTNGSPDFYDVSLVDGFNVPMSIVPSDSTCGTASCPVDLNAICPAELQAKDSNGKVVICKTACSAGLGNTANGSPNCCTGDYGTPDKCPSSGVTDYSFFKGNCPNAYAFAYDEPSGTALWTCGSTGAPSYTLTFCP